MTPTMAHGEVAQQEQLDAETMWRCLSLLVSRMFAVLESQTVVDDCLDILVEVLGADRGLILLSSGGTSHIVNARRQKKNLKATEREEISRTIVRQASETGRCIVWRPLDSEVPSTSMIAFGIVAAVAAPLHVDSTGHKRKGVLYVDYGDPRKYVGQSHVELFMASALLLGAVLEQEDRAEETRDRLREAESHCVDSTRPPPLSELLAPASMQLIRREVESALYGTSPILILGESGTGKTMLAQAIAEASGRRPIVRAVLGSSDDLNTITSDLYGHEKGSYSGATSRRVGLVEYANKGTLILDEVLNLPPHAQKLLLDFTQFGTYRPLGYDRPEPKRSSARIIAATNGDMRAAIQDGRFRLDLFHRLAAVSLVIPPLRDRREDIIPLAETTLLRLGGRPLEISVPLRRVLVSPAARWPGNVRQLERVITRARERALARDPEATMLTPLHLEPHDIDGTPTAGAGAASSDEQPADLGSRWQRLQAERSRLEELEQSVIQLALSNANGVVAQAARELGIARTTLSSRIDALALRASRPRRSDPPATG